MPDITRDQIAERLGELARAEPDDTDDQNLLYAAKDLIDRGCDAPISQMDEGDCFWYAEHIGAMIGIGNLSGNGYVPLVHGVGLGWRSLCRVQHRVDALREALRHTAKMESRHAFLDGKLVKVGPCYVEETDSLGKPEVLADA